MTPVLATLSEWHIVLVLIIVFLLFGGKKLPELARGIGEAMKEFKKAQREAHDESQRPPSPATTPTAPTTTTTPTTPTQPMAGAPQSPTDPKLN